MRRIVKRDFLILAVIIFILGYYREISKDKECQTIPRKDTYIIDENVNSYWKSEYVRGYHKVICRCPSIYGDSLVYYNDVLVSYTSTTLWSDTYFLTCDENILAMMTTGNYFKTRIENIEMFVSYLFKDIDDKIIGYSDARYKLSDIIVIKDVNGDQISILEKTQLSIGWTWNITVSNQNHTLSDPSILLALVGKREFGEKDDICNIMWIMISVCLIVFCTLMAIAWAEVTYGS